MKGCPGSAVAAQACMVYRRPCERCVENSTAINGVIAHTESPGHRMYDVIAKKAKPLEPPDREMTVSICIISAYPPADAKA